MTDLEVIDRIYQKCKDLDWQPVKGGFSLTVPPFSMSLDVLEEPPIPGTKLRFILVVKSKHNIPVERFIYSQDEPEGRKMRDFFDYLYAKHSSLRVEEVEQIRRQWEEFLSG